MHMEGSEILMGDLLTLHTAVIAVARVGALPVGAS